MAAWQPTVRYFIRSPQKNRTSYWVLNRVHPALPVTFIIIIFHDAVVRDVYLYVGRDRWVRKKKQSMSKSNQVNLLRSLYLIRETIQ